MQRKTANELLGKTGLISILLYLRNVHEKQNRTQIIANSYVNPMTVASALDMLKYHGLVTVEKGNLFNQTFHELTEKGRRVADLLQQIVDLL